MVSDAMVEVALKVWLEAMFAPHELPREQDVEATYRTVTREMLEAAEAAAWRPIAEAKKDGTRYQLLRQIDTMRFRDLPPIAWIKVGQWCCHWRDGYEQGWREDAPAATFQDAAVFKLIPTHFRPLPTPPKDPTDA